MKRRIHQKFYDTVYELRDSRASEAFTNVDEHSVRKSTNTELKSVSILLFSQMFFFFKQNPNLNDVT